MGAFTKLILALVVVFVEGIDGARILGLFPLATRSHFAVSETLMRALAARGHQVDVVSPFPLKNPTPNYRDISIADDVPSSVNNLTLKEAEIYTALNLRKMIELGGTSTCELLALPQLQNIIKNPPTNPPYDLIVYELFGGDCYLAFARRLNVPIVGIVASKLFDWMNHPLGNPLSSAFVPSSFTRFDQRMTFAERLENVLTSAFLRATYWRTVYEQKSHVKKYFDLDVSSMSELYDDVAVVLVNTHPSFDFVRPLTPRVIEVGGLQVTEGNKDLSPEIKKWLDDSEQGCVYFAFGSMIRIESFPAETIEAFYETFRRIAPVRVLVKIAKSDELPAGLPSNVITSPWLPQARVLQHKNVKALITHCGLMTIHEAVTFAVPMVGVPIFSDQHLNARLCEKHNIMVTVDYRKITADSFTDAITSVLKNSTYSENSRRLAKLFVDRPLSAMDTAIYWIEYVVRHGKNVLKSPAEQLQWWQLELLDVYGFLIAIVLLAFYAVKRAVGLIFRRLLSKSTLPEKSRSSKAASRSKKNK